jgi:hypothetical protein
MCATVGEILNGNSILKDRMMEQGNTICPWSFYSQWWEHENSFSGLFLFDKPFKIIPC